MNMEAVRRTTRSDCGHGCVIRRAGEERASAPIRALVAVFVALLAVHFMSGTAYADSVNAEIISGPSQVPILDMYGASIAAPDRYTAAALLMAYGPDAISGWDDDVKAKLSNAETGGNFYTFATNSVQNYYDITEHTGIFHDYFNFVGGAFWNAAQALYGNNLWAALYTSDELAAAKADLQRVLSGEDLGGGGSGGGSGLSFDTSYANQYRSTYNVNGTDGKTYNAGINLPSSVTEMPGSVSFVLSGTDLPSLETSAIDYSYIYQASSSEIALEVLHFSSAMQIVSFADGKGIIFPLRFANPSESTTNSELTRVVYYFRIESFDGTTFTATYISSYTYPLTSIRPGSYFQIVNYAQPRFFISGGGSGGGGGEPVVPPTNWPEPETPEPPELPEPGDPVVEPPEPYEPSTGPTYIWNTTNTSEPTDTSDLLEWIKKIFYELKAIHSDLKTWFENLGTAITDGFEAMDNSCGQIYGAITEQTDDMISQFSGLKTYLKQLFEWLGDKMSFQSAGYDDTSVIYWLKRIWSKLGNGDINVRPTDPTTDPTGVWDWLIKLIQNFLIGLASSANDLISEMADLVSQVMHEFPFSIPWDIAAYLAAFAAAPITPDVDVTIPAIEGWWGETVISIDLSPYDTAAAAVRAMEKILFAAFLAWKSRDLLEFMDVTKWFNG